MTNTLELLQIKDKLANILLRSNTGNQCGIGISEKDDAVVVYLRQETEKGKQHVQSMVGGSTADGYEIIYRSAGHIQSLQSCAYSRTEYNRPVCGGDSIGHSSVTAGTLGSAVYDNITGKRYGLSNNHILSASTSDIIHNADIGNPIYAPGCYDSGGQCLYPIGTLAKFISFNEYQLNYVDCALVSPKNDTDISDTVNGIGLVEYHKEPVEGMQVHKSGRTTGITNGQIIDVNAIMEVDYGGRILRFDNCIVTEAMASNGDSGSILADSIDNKAVGLLFAGSDQLTIYNKIGFVLSALNVKMSPKDIVSTEYIPYVTSDIFSDITNFVPVIVGIAGVLVISTTCTKFINR